MPGYLTKQESIAVAGVDNLIIRSLLDRQQYADPLGEADRLGISSAAWPMFGLLWPSGAHLAARLARRPVLAAERILEIGCGLGLASLVGHRRGADVTASDCHPLAGAFLLENQRLNGLLPMKYRHGQWGVAAVAPVVPLLAAVAPDGALLVLPALPVELEVQGEFDLIIGSDLLYERDADATLAAYIALHAAPAAEVWIVDPDRGNRPAFNRGMAEQGFAHREEPLVAPPSGGTGAGAMAAYKGRLLVYRRTAVLTRGGGGPI